MKLRKIFIIIFTTFLAFVLHRASTQYEDEEDTPIRFTQSEASAYVQSCINAPVNPPDSKPTSAMCNCLLNSVLGVPLGTAKANLPNYIANCRINPEPF